MLYISQKIVLFIKIRKLITYILKLYLIIIVQGDWKIFPDDPFYLSADQQQRVPGGLGSDGERDLGDLVVVARGGGGHNDAGLGRRGADH